MNAMSLMSWPSGLGVVIILLGALAALGLVAALFGWLSKDDGTAGIQEGASCDTCDGSNEKCEQTCLLEAAVKPIEYFDDEELDAYAHRRSDAYTDEEAEQFEEVLTTLRPDEVAAWNRSLILRGINVPDQIKDELVMLLAESSH